MRTIPFLALLTWLVSTSSATNRVTGLVSNQSHGQPAAGAEVILVRIEQGMPEEARAKTDVQGQFAFHLQYPDKPYLVRALYQNVSYDRKVPADGILTIPVFEASPEVSDVTGTIEILRAGTSGTLLHVSDMYEITNGSSPPLTRVGEHTFEVHLPPKARIDSVLAAGPENIGLMISAAPVFGKPGRYSVNFPLRPGATKFAFNYDLPFDGRAAFQTWHVYPLQQLAVMLPPSMSFSSRSPGFQILPTGNTNYQVHAANQVKAGAGPVFEISGIGALPPVRNQPELNAWSRSSIPSNSAAPVPGHAVVHSWEHRDPYLGTTQSSARSLVWAAVSCAILVVFVLSLWSRRRARRQEERSR
jgi:hypothetical protein